MPNPMPYSEQTSMHDLLRGMAAVDADACHEFARRQYRAGHGADLGHAAALIHDLAFEIQLARPDTLMRWKYPARFDPIDPGLLADLLQAASEADRDTARGLMNDRSFADVTALSSIATHLGQSLAQIERYGTPAPDPQRSLF